MELPRKVEDWPEEMREMYEERAAIIEYEDGQPRARAERYAELDIRRILYHRQTNLPF